MSVDSLRFLFFFRNMGNIFFFLDDLGLGFAIFFGLGSLGLFFGLGSLGFFFGHGSLLRQSLLCLLLRLLRGRGWRYRRVADPARRRHPDPRSRTRLSGRRRDESSPAAPSTTCQTNRWRSSGRRALVVTRPASGDESPARPRASSPVSRDAVAALSAGAAAVWCRRSLPASVVPQRWSPYMCLIRCQRYDLLLTTWQGKNFLLTDWHRPFLLTHRIYDLQLLLLTTMHLV